MRCTRTGREVEIQTPEGQPPATVSGDEYECIECGATVVTSFGDVYRGTAESGSYSAADAWPDDIRGHPV